LIKMWVQSTEGYYMGWQITTSIKYQRHVSCSFSEL